MSVFHVLTFIRLREICSSDSDEVYEERVRCFKETEVFKSNPKLRGWLETRWFPEHKVKVTSVAYWYLLKKLFMAHGILFESFFVTVNRAM